MKDYSQYGESKILLDLVKKIGTINEYIVEFGASDGYRLSNARMFIEMGWQALQMDGIVEPKNGVKFEFITKENINDLFKKYDVPNKFDILSIDIDGNDYWVWKELEYNPNIVIIEYNSNFNVNESYTLKYNPEHNFDESGGFYSASVKAFVDLAKNKGYFLHREIAYTNLIFVKNEYKELISEFDYHNLNLPKDHHGGKDLEKFIEV
jgi:hypothetical protein